MPDPNAGDINPPRGVRLVARPMSNNEMPGRISASAKVKRGISAFKVAFTTDLDKMLGKALQALLKRGGVIKS
jgi:hypothetical protein